MSCRSRLTASGGWASRSAHRSSSGCQGSGWRGQAAPSRLRRVLETQARRIQRSRAQPSAVQAIRSDVVAVARDAGGRKLAAAHLTGGDPYSFTAPILAWAAGTAAAQGVRPAGALGPVEAFGLDSLESACANAGFSRETRR